MLTFTITQFQMMKGRLLRLGTIKPLVGIHVEEKQEEVDDDEEEEEQGEQEKHEQRSRGTRSRSRAHHEMKITQA